jgi:hypothetical protein
LPRDDLLSGILGRLGFRKKAVVFSRFRDGLGNFELFYPQGWEYDEDIAVMDGKYTISFTSRDKLSQFTVSVDTMLPENFDFERYAREELESPTSGIYTPVVGSTFHGMPSFDREYSFTSGGRGYFGGGVMFFTGGAVFSLSWSAPQSRTDEMAGVFGHMKDTMAVRAGFIREGKLPSVEPTERPKKRRRRRAERK